MDSSMFSCESTKSSSSWVVSNCAGSRVPELGFGLSICFGVSTACAARSFLFSWTTSQFTFPTAPFPTFSIGVRSSLFPSAGFLSSSIFSAAGVDLVSVPVLVCWLVEGSVPVMVMALFIGVGERGGSTVALSVALLISREALSLFTSRVVFSRR